jgi:acyl transferase domain-containing protein/acyl carrier protein
MTAERTATEPIAIVGMACRFPGDVSTPEALWDLLVAGRDALDDIPADRWEAYTLSRPANAAAMRDTTRRGGFLTDVAGFDAEFFQITPREAALIDPQQRLVLETTWEALEHAGIPPHTLAGTDGSVFMGVGSDDYGRQMLEDLPRIEAWTGIGASCCAVANRVSYLLDLNGPSFTADAACASSLVAVHLAGAALRAGETGLAIAGGVNVIAGPGLTMVLDAAGAISPEGRSMPFDASANGYVRGEGAGVVILKRLADAQRDGDRVLATIRGSAVSHDGRTNGIMAPNGAAQASVARLALRQAGIDARSVGYVEAHGTGTRLGDPIEADALSAVYGENRPTSQPCLIGSVKSNIGHLEAAAGVAGLIKAVLVLEHREIPPQAGFGTPNPAVPWDRSGLRVTVERTAWLANGHPRRAGVSSFGYGGTVSHVVLEEAPDQAPAPAEPPGLAVYPLSGATANQVRAQAGQLANLIADKESSPALADLRHTLWQRRTHLAARAAIVAADQAALRYELRKLEADQPAAGTVTGTGPAHGERQAVWVFSGHGSQWTGMGRELLADEPAFAAVVDIIDPVFTAECGFSARQLLLDDDLADVDRIQSAIFVMHVGLAAVWRDLGLRPAAVIGHSVGEIAAAVTAGVFSLTDGARLICRRSQLLRKVAGAGAMAMVQLPFDEVRALLGTEDDVAAAVQSSPVSTVVSGSPEAVAAFRDRCAQDGIVIRPVASDVAFHSPQMEPLLADLEAAVHDLVPAAAQIPLYTTALPDPRANPLRDGHYWAANLRNPVRLATAVTAAAADGHPVFLELSPHPVVVHSISETLADSQGDSFATGSLRRGQPERATLRLNLGALYCHGCAVDTARLGAAGTLVTLPPMAWRHHRHWKDQDQAHTHWGALFHDVASAALLGAEVALADPTAPRIWRTRLDYGSRPYPGTHEVLGTEIVPAAVVLNTFFAAAGQRRLAGVRFLAALPSTDPREIQVLDRDGAITLAARPAEAPWQIHATATRDDTERPAPPFDVSACRRQLEPDSAVQRLRALGIAGAGLPWTVAELAAGDGELTARILLDGDGPDDVAWARLVDALASLVPLLTDDDTGLRLVSGIQRIALDGAPPAEAVVHLRDHGGDAGVDAVVADCGGTVRGFVEGLRMLPVDGAAESAADPARLVHQVEWRRLADPGSSRELRSLILVGPDSALRQALVRQAQAEGVRCQTASAPYAQFLDAALDERDMVLVLGPGPAADAADAAETGTWRLARTAQLLAERARPRPPALWCVTQGVRECDSAACLPQAPLWGLGRIVAGEHPDLWGGIVDCDPADPEAAAAAVLAELRAGREPDLLAPRGQVTEAARLVPVTTDPSREALRCHPDATYLITGGLGVLGLEVARWLAGRGARRLVLVSRTPMPPRSDWYSATADPRVERIRELEALGVTVRTLAVDITDATAVTAALSGDALDLPPVRGVVHAAGVLDSRLLDGLDQDSLHRVMRPKVAGALVLDQLFPPGSLDFFVLFSSFGQFLGLAGQSSYASANALLDGLARFRGDALSLSWTSWRDLGMGANEVVASELRERGIGDVSARDAFLAWEHASRHDVRHVCVFPTLERDQQTDPAPVLRELEFGKVTTEPGPDTRADRMLTGLTGAELHAAAIKEVSRIIGAELRLAADDLDVRVPLTALGLDSVMTVAIRRALEKRFRMPLPATLLWNRPTVTAIADYLAERLA